MEAPPLERRLVAILAADVEGYSRLMHGDEEATMATLSACRALADELIAQHRGRIANTAGDSVLAEFASVLDARGRDPSGASKGQRRRAARTPDALPDRRQCRRRHGQGRRHLPRRRERHCSARGAGQGRRDLHLAGRARSPASSRRHGLSTIWASNWSRTSRTRSERFASASVRIHLSKRS